MKQKLSFVLGGLLIAGVMVGCSAEAKPQETAYISRDKARAVALAAAGVDAGSASITDTQLSERDGMAYYEIDFTAAGMEYNYSVDAVTGIVIESKNETPLDNGSAVTDYDALSSAPVRDDAAVTDFDTTNTGSNNVAANTGGTTGGTSSGGANAAKAPTAPSQTAPTPPASPAPPAVASKEITLEQAKQIALEHAGKTNVTFVKAEKDFDDGAWVYEIEFITQSGNSYQEYDYEISASTGKVLSFDYDAESYAPPKQDTATKTEAEVRKIALAKVPGAKASDCILSLDQDDGRLVYEGKIIHNQMEYEFEIDAHSGTILEWDVESIYD